MRALSPRLMLLVLGQLCAGSVGLALLAQHRFDMQPCPWCILQRILFIVLSVLALVGAALPGNLGRRVLSALSLPLALGGIAAALWQHFVAAKTSSCALTFADRVNSYFGLDTRWPEWFEVRANCSDAAVSVLGVPFEFWALALFAVATVVLSISVVTSRRA